MSKRLKTTLLSSLTVVALLGALAVVPAGAIDSPEHYTLVDNAEYVTPGLSGSDRAVKLTSDTATTTAWGSIEYGVEDGITFSELTYLGSEFMMETGDSCGGGAPRFFIQLDEDEDGVASSTDGHIFAYFGDSPDFTCDDDITIDTGDLLASGMTVDSSQLGGTFYHDYDDALTAYGDLEVLALGISVDAGWMDAANGDDTAQVATIDNTMVNDTLFTYEVPEEPTEDTEELCTDEIDNDEDTLIDEADPDCDPFFEEGSISGLKWNDEDGEGDLDLDEEGVEGVTIFLDDNDNGLLDDGEATTTTDIDGNYSFEGLAAGDYVVCEVVEEGWDRTSPSDSDCQDVTVLEDTETLDVNFGNVEEDEDEEDGVAVCHVPPGNPAAAHTIFVGEPAVETHLGHGDSRGECEDVEEFSSSNGNGNGRGNGNR